MRIAVCSGGSNPRNTDRWTQITSDKQIHKTGKKCLIN